MLKWHFAACPSSALLGNSTDRISTPRIGYTINVRACVYACAPLWMSADATRSAFGPPSISTRNKARTTPLAAKLGRSLLRKPRDSLRLRASSHLQVDIPIYSRHLDFCSQDRINVADAHLRREQFQLPRKARRDKSLHSTLAAGTTPSSS